LSENLAENSSHTPAQAPPPSFNHSKTNTFSDAMDIDSISTAPTSQTIRPRGPLTPAERQHRYSNNLCIICGSKDHLKLACPKRRPTTNIAAINVHPRPSAVLAQSSDPNDLSLFAISSSLCSVSVPSALPHPSKFILKATLNLASTSVLIDSGADQNFISLALVDQLALNLVALEVPITIRLAAQATEYVITHRTTPSKLQLNEHSELISFLVLPALAFPIILGYAWLALHNPQINWSLQTITFESSKNVATIQETSPNMQIYPFMHPVQTPTTNPLPVFLNEYADVFSKTLANQLPPHRHFDFPINLLPNSVPPYSKVYSLTIDEKESMQKWVKQNLELGLIRPSKSPFGAPCFFIKKKDGSLRLCVDYRRLNAITVKDRNPLPLISDLIRQLAKAKFFTVLDLRGAYNLIRIQQGHEFKTAFVTTEGQFESLVMGFGPSNCPAHFQSIMNEIFKSLLGKAVEIYLDDIVIYSLTIEEHWIHVKQALEILRLNKLFCKLEKCSFGSQSISFLGYIISNRGISMDPSKIRSILDWPAPTSLKQLQEFLGFCNFYRRFIPNFSPITRPLTLLLQKDVEYVWDPPQQSAYTRLKSQFDSASMLMHPNDAKPFFVETDASDFGIGGILSQINSVNVLQPIAFYSRQLNPAERNYTIYDKELIAVYACFQEWRHFLQGGQHPVTVFSDHKNLEFFMTSQKLTRRQARWSLFLNEFSFFIVHRPGRLNMQADLLSRRPDFQVPLEKENLAQVLKRSHVASTTLLQHHQRFGHPGLEILKKTLPVVLGTKVPANSRTSCLACSLGKSTRPNIRNTSDSSQFHSILEIISSDTQGPFPLNAIDGTCNNIKFVDSRSKYCKMETIPNRLAETIANTFKRFQARMERRTGSKIKYIRTDGGTEYMGAFLDHLERSGITKQKSTSHSHVHPGQAERIHQSIMTRARAMLIASKLPANFYAEAQLTAAYLHNRLLHGQATQTPYQQIYGKKPDISHLRPFGCVGFAHLPLESRNSKLSDTAVQCRLIGYADDDDTEEIKGYKLLQESDPSIIFYSSDVRFDETLEMTPLAGYSVFDPYDTTIFIDPSYSEENTDDDHSQNDTLTPPGPSSPSLATPETRRHTRATYSSIV
jgi:hypothetical protein